MDLGEHVARFRSLVRDRAGPFAGSFDTFDAAGLLEPLSVGIWASRRAAVIPGSSVLVTGAGPFAVDGGVPGRRRGTSERPPTPTMATALTYRDHWESRLLRTRRGRPGGEADGYRVAMSSLFDFLAEPRNIIIAGVKRDGRPHLSPCLFFWDGERFFISTTRDRVKYKIFRRDPRAELIVDDATGHRYARVSGTVEVLEDIPSNLPMDRAIREKHGMAVAADEQLAASLIADNRVLLAVTPAKPASEWSVLGVEARAETGLRPPI